MQKFELLKEFQRENGHCRVPQRLEVAESVQLGKWVHTQRCEYKKFMKGSGPASITQDRIDKLNMIGFQWSVNRIDAITKDAAWNEQFELLSAFKRNNGNCRVRLNYEVGSIKLGQWVSQQRKFYRNLTKQSGQASISQERIDKLNSIGFEWSIIAENAWDQKFALLCTFHQKYGHCRVRLRYEVNSVKLGQWVHKQRCFYRILKKGSGQASITQERIDKLNSIGFEWSPASSSVCKAKAATG